MTNSNSKRLVTHNTMFQDSSVNMENRRRVCRKCIETEIMFSKYSY